MIRALFATLALFVATQAVNAADITLTFANATSEETRAATWKLSQVNQVRTGHGLEAHASVADWLKDMIQNTIVPQWIQQEAEARRQEQDVQTLWKNATDAQRAAAIAALQS